MGTAIKHPAVPDLVKPLFVIFDIWALRLRADCPCPDVKNYK